MHTHLHLKKLNNTNYEQSVNSNNIMMYPSIEHMCYVWEGSIYKKNAHECTEYEKKELDFANIDELDEERRDIRSRIDATLTERKKPDQGHEMSDEMYVPILNKFDVYFDENDKLERVRLDISTLFAMEDPDDATSIAIIFEDNKMYIEEDAASLCDEGTPYMSMRGYTSKEEYRKDQFTELLKNDALQLNMILKLVDLLGF